MTIRKRTALPLALALGALGAMVLASVASATHPRPLSATPLVASLVPAFNECTGTGNRTHGPPLVFPSCNPPVQTSANITVGTFDANGANSNMKGSIRLSVKVGVPGPPEDSDVKITANITDVRCKAGNTACGSANAADGADYTGEVQGNALIRITDHWNAVAPGGGPDAVISASMLPPDVGSMVPSMPNGNGGEHLMGLPLREAREVFEREYLVAQISRFGGNISRTAEFVGMERSALHRKLKALGID